MSFLLRCNDCRFVYATTGAAYRCEICGNRGVIRDGRITVNHYPNGYPATLLGGLN